MDDFVTIRFKGRVTLEVCYGPDDTEETCFFPEDEFIVRREPSDLPGKSNLEFDNGSYILDVLDKLFVEVYE